MAEPSPSGPWWDLAYVVMPALIPTAVAAALEVWRVRRRDRHPRTRPTDDDLDDEEDSPCPRSTALRA